MTMLEMGSPIIVKYTNWKGETANRTIIPHKVWFGSTEYHKEPQWLVYAFDSEKRAYRDFALSDMSPVHWRELRKAIK